MSAAQSDAPAKLHLHIGDYLRDTYHLTQAEHGAYFLLLLWYYSTGKSIPNDTARIYARTLAYSPTQRRTVRKVLAEFFKLEGDRFIHKRVEAELDHGRSVRLAAQNSAHQRWHKSSKNNGSADANAMQALGLITTTPSKISDTPTRRAAAAGQINGSVINTLNGQPHWWATEAGTLAKGLELGIRSRPGESWQVYRDRIRKGGG